jgi:nicotinamidase-related amidase
MTMTGNTALLIIDMLNTFDFDDYEHLLEASREIVEPINRLRAKARKAGMPVIYVNDNYGRWRDDRAQLVGHLTSEGMRGADIARAVAPAQDDYFVVKPEASGFYATPLPALLPRLKVTRLILTGVAADICVQFTAADAHMREYELWVPRDAVAGSQPERVKWALGIMADSLGADTRATTERQILLQ